MESYCVSYPTSLGGDFTIWFINKHFGVEQKGFVGFDDMYVFKSPHIFRNYFEDSFVDDDGGGSSTESDVTQVDQKASLPPRGRLSSRRCYVLELFGGTCRLSSAVAKQGL